MSKQNILDEYKKQEDKILLSQILDKMDFCEKRNKIEYTDFLDMYQVSIVKNFLRKIQCKSYILYGGFENAERQIAIFYPDSYDLDMVKKNYDKIFKIIRITLPQEDIGKYSHRNYLGGIVKLGIKREKIGDILVSNEGADIIVKEEIAESLQHELGTLTRFENAKIEINKIENIRKQEIKLEEVSIIVPSLRLDNIVSDLAKTSRNKAAQIRNQERVFVNGQNETKVSKNLKLNDIITIRGKGRYVIKEYVGTTRSGRTILRIEKYV